MHLHGNLHHFSQVWIQLFFEQTGTPQAMVRNTQTLQNSPNEEERRDGETTFPFWQIHTYWNVFSVWILAPWQLFTQPFWKYFLIHPRLSYCTSYKRMLHYLFLILPFTRKNKLSKVSTVTSSLFFPFLFHRYVQTWMRVWLLRLIIFLALLHEELKSILLLIHACPLRAGL